MTETTKALFPPPHNLMRQPSEPTAKTLSDAAIDWLVLLRSGSATQDELNQFHAWLDEALAHRTAFAEAEALWGAVGLAFQSGPVPKPRRPPARPRRLKPALALAASLAGCAWLGWPPLADWLWSDYATAAGEQREVILADHSSVLLNTDSAIALDWNAEKRRIVLRRGQALFKVAKDAAGRPFEVVADKAAIRALGTAFEVFKQGDGALDVIVNEHAVNITLPGPNAAPVRVEQGQGLHYVGHGSLSRPAAVNLNLASAWQRKKLVFRDQPLAEVVAELNRYSKGRVLIGGTGIAALRVSGIFPMDDLSYVLDAIQNALSIHSTRIGPWLVILHS